VVSELVTNSILHAELSPNDQISLTVTVLAGSVCGRVMQSRLWLRGAFGALPAPRHEWWMGLPIVETISDRWGVERNNHVCVWFEID
jgi:anti-sigma regulatory factor (Ser/Thr protein kinase)